MYRRTGQDLFQRGHHSGGGEWDLRKRREDQEKNAVTGGAKFFRFGQAKGVGVRGVRGDGGDGGVVAVVAVVAAVVVAVVVVEVFVTHAKQGEDEREGSV